MFVQPLRHLNVSVEALHYDIIPPCVSVCCPVSVSGISGCECGGWEHLVTRCFVVVVQCSLPGAALVDCPVNVLTGPSVLLRTLNFACVLGVGEFWKIVITHELGGTDHSTCKDYVEQFFWCMRFL